MTAEYWEVFAVRYATRTAPRSTMFLHYEVYGDVDSSITMDYFFWVLRRGEELVLVDTGFSAQAAADRGREMLVHPVRALDLLDARPDDVDLVVATHAHYDHIGNVREFPQARVLMSRREYDFCTGPVAGHPIFRGTIVADEVDVLRERHERGALELVDHEAVARPGIRLTEVGGHTPGQLVVAVETRGGPVVLTSDAAHFYEELERDRPFTHVVDLGAMLTAYGYLRALPDDHVLVAGHDPAVMDRFPGCDGPLRGVAVQIDASGGGPGKGAVR